MAVASVVTMNPSATPGDLERELARLRAENETLRSRAVRVGRLSMKVSEKGAVSVYGLGRFPVTLYAEQWGRLLGAAEELKSFLVENHSKLSFKDSK